MTYFSVYHKKDPDFMEVPDAPDITEYDFVALVDCEDVEDAFRLTNHIDRNWQENPEVVRTNPDMTSFRSTSVGDLIVKCPIECPEEGVTFFSVNMIGMKKHN